MPLENLEEEGLPKNPDLRIAQLRFLLSLQPQRPDPAVRQELMAAIRRHGEASRGGSRATSPAPSSAWAWAAVGKGMAALCTCSEAHRLGVL